MQFTLFLVLAALMVAFAQQPFEIFDFTQVAPCAQQCLVLKAGQQHCTPPMMPAFDGKTYLACFCNLRPLMELYVRPGKCSQFCNDVEQGNIYAYFNILCKGGMTAPTISGSILEPPSTHTGSFAPSSLPSATSTSFLPLVAASTTSSAANQPTEFAPPSPLKDHGAWLHGNWKYLVVAGVLLLATMAILLTVAFLHHRRRQAFKATSTNEGNGAIPLRSLSPPAHQSRPGTSGSEVGEEPTTPASPLAPTNSPHSFGETLRTIARDEQERDAWYAARREAGYVPSWKLPKDPGTLGDE